MNARRLTVSSLVSLCTLAGVALLCSSPALAVRGHLFSGAFGEPCTSEPCGKGQLEEPGGVAVNETSGNVYVIDRGDKRVEWFSSSGTYLGQFDGSGSFEVGGKVEAATAAGSGGHPNEISTGQFSKPVGIAIDNACELHAPVLTEVTTPTCHEFDPSAGDVYVFDSSHEVVDKFTATGEYVGQITGTPAGLFTRLVGVSVDQNGTVWTYRSISFLSAELDRFGDHEQNEFVSSRFIARHPGIENSGLFTTDFDKTFDYFYISGGAILERLTSLGEGVELINGGNSLDEPSVPLPERTEPLVEVLAAGLTTGLAVESTRHDVYVDNADSVSRFGPDRSPIEQLGLGELIGGSGVGVNASGEEVYVADSAADVVDLFVPDPPSAPKITSPAVSFVTSGSATFSALINPQDVRTEYRFEYGTTSSYDESVPVPDSVAGSDFELHEEDVHVQDLAPHTTYHFRVVARNALGVTESPDQTFVTQTSSGGFTLPDGRSYEMVTPPDKQGALFYGLSISAVGGESDALVAQAAADGSAMIDLASQPTEAEPQGYTNEESVLSTRGPGGWASQVIAPPHSAGTGASSNIGREYRFFSEDLSQGVMQPFGKFTPLSPEATETTAYLRTDFIGGNVSEHCTVSCYQPLVTAGNARQGAIFGEEMRDGECEEERFLCGPQFVGATPDLSHVLLSSPVQLTAGAIDSGGLYEWAGEKLQLVSILPEGQAGALILAGTSGSGLARHAISDDGERIVMENDSFVHSEGAGLYLRDVAKGETKGETIRLDLPEGGTGASETPEYMTASNDVSKIFFIDKAGLTTESSASGRDLYEYDLNKPAGKRLADLTVSGQSGEPANVRSVLGASEDGSYLYFTAGGALTEGGVNGECTPHEGSPFLAEIEGCNIYVLHAGVTRLIASGWKAEQSGEESARVSPDGRWLSFMSSQDLTGYDTRDAISGRPDMEVYLYEASENRLVCASCNPTGARPVGVEINGANELGLVVGSIKRGLWMASTVPPREHSTGAESLYQPRYLSDSGRLFFDSDDALVPQDVNGTEDVYEYEPADVGSCNASNITFSERSGGCVNPISSGASPEESAFLDASVTGSDVFFITLAKLAPEDFDSALDVYDAHECTSDVPCYPTPAVVPPVCSTGDSCKAAPSPQPAIFGPTSSATFSGAGNVIPTVSTPKAKVKSLTQRQRLSRALKECKREGRKRRGMCERKARKRYKLGQSHKASANRRGRR